MPTIKSIYTGREWQELLAALRGREVRQTVAAAYRTAGRKVSEPARQKLAASGLSHAAAMKRNIRVRPFPRGTGFMVTVKPHGRVGSHRNRRGLLKPVLLFAEEGTKERRTRRPNPYGRRHGTMPALHLLEPVERQGAAIIEEELRPAVEQAVMKQAKKLGWD